MKESVPMARPALPSLAVAESAPARTPKGQAAVDKILAAAIELLAHEGQSALSMRRVAERLNLRLSAVQHHFPTWEELFQAMMSRVLAQYVAIVDRYLHEKATRLKQFENVLNYLLRDIKSPVSQSLFAQLWSLAQTNDYARRVMLEMYAYERGVFEFLIAEINPALERRDVARRAALMVTQIEGLMLLIPQQSRFPAGLAGIEQVCLDQILALAHAPPGAAGAGAPADG